MKRTLVWLVLMAVVVACGGGGSSGIARRTYKATPTEPPTTGAWTQGAPMPTPRSDAASAVVDGKIYVIGGLLASGESTDTVEVYDPATDTWETLAPLQGFDHAMAATVGGKIYVIGGHSSSGDQISPTTNEYDPATGVRGDRAAMPEPRAAGAAATLGDGRIYVVGGYGPDAGAVLMYDPEKDTWEAKPATATPREQLTAQAAGQVIYAIGGLADRQTLSKLEVYSPAANTWLGLGPMPTARSALASAVLRNRIHVLGGADGTGAALATHEVYNPDLSTWSPAPPMATARHGLAVQVVGDKLYAIGGATGADGAASALVEIFTPSP